MTCAPQQQPYAAQAPQGPIKKRKVKEALSASAAGAHRPAARVSQNETLCFFCV